MDDEFADVLDFLTDKFGCSTCPSRFSSSQAFDEHECTTQIRCERYRRTECRDNHLFDTMDAFVAHFLDKHILKAACMICMMNFNEYERRMDHIRSHGTDLVRKGVMTVRDDSSPPAPAAAGEPAVAAAAAAVAWTASSVAPAFAAAAAAVAWSASSSAGPSNAAATSPIPPDPTPEPAAAAPAAADEAASKQASPPPDPAAAAVAAPIPATAPAAAAAAEEQEEEVDDETRTVIEKVVQKLVNTIEDYEEYERTGVDPRERRRAERSASRQPLKRPRTAGVVERGEGSTKRARMDPSRGVFSTPPRNSQDETMEASSSHADPTSQPSTSKQHPSTLTSVPVTSSISLQQQLKQSPQGAAQAAASHTSTPFALEFLTRKSSAAAAAIPAALAAAAAPWTQREPKEEPQPYLSAAQALNLNLIRGTSSQSRCSSYTEPPVFSPHHPLVGVKPAALLGDHNYPRVDPAASEMMEKERTPQVAASKSLPQAQKAQPLKKVKQEQMEVEESTAHEAPVKDPVNATQPTLVSPIVINKKNFPTMFGKFMQQTQGVQLKPVASADEAAAAAAGQDAAMDQGGVEDNVMADASSSTFAADFVEHQVKTEAAAPSPQPPASAVAAATSRETAAAADAAPPPPPSKRSRKDHGQTRTIQRPVLFSFFSGFMELAEGIKKRERAAAMKPQHDLYDYEDEDPSTSRVGNGIDESLNKPTKDTAGPSTSGVDMDQFFKYSSNASVFAQRRSPCKSVKGSYEAGPSHNDSVVPRSREDSEISGRSSASCTHGGRRSTRETFSESDEAGPSNAHYSTPCGNDSQLLNDSDVAGPSSVSSHRRRPRKSFSDSIEEPSSSFTPLCHSTPQVRKRPRKNDSMEESSEASSFTSCMKKSPRKSRLEVSFKVDELEPRVQSPINWEEEYEMLEKKSIPKLRERKSRSAKIEYVDLTREKDEHEKWYDGETDDKHCPQCSVNVGSNPFRRKAHYRKFHYDVYYKGDARSMQVDQWVSTKVGDRGDEDEKDDRVCMHCPDSEMFRCRQDLLRHIKQTHKPEFIVLKEQYRIFARTKPVPEFPKTHMMLI